MTRARSWLAFLAGGAIRLVWPTLFALPLVAWLLSAWLGLA